MELGKSFSDSIKTPRFRCSRKRRPASLQLREQEDE